MSNESEDSQDENPRTLKEVRGLLPDVDQPTQNALFVVYLEYGENIPVSDRSGTTDPYVVAKLEGTRKESPVIKATLEPKWNTVLLIPYTGKPDSELILELWDWNMIQHHKYLGSIEFRSDYKTQGHRSELKELEHDGKVVVGKNKAPTRLKLKLWHFNPFKFEGRLFFTRLVARKVRFSGSRETKKKRNNSI